MKGLSKGLKYFSQFFENDQKEEEEEEIQIGAPTDVKHVAHIGNDAQRNNAPSWMNEFQVESTTGENKDDRSTNRKENKDGPSSQGPTTNCETNDNDQAKTSGKESLSRDIGELQESTSMAKDGTARHNSTRTKHSRHQTSETYERSRENSEGTKTRRHKSLTSDNSNRDTLERPRRIKNSNSGLDSSLQDPNGCPTRKCNRRKSRAGDRTRSSRSKESSDSVNSNFGNLELGSEHEMKDNNDKEPDTNSDNDEENLGNEMSSEPRAL